MNELKCESQLKNISQNYFLGIEYKQMPRKYKKTWKKRKPRWKRKGFSLVRQPQAVIAKTQVVRMKYGTFITVNPTSAVAATYVFSCNNINDPDTTSTGHRPMGHAEWGAFYNHYTVIGSKIRATFNPTSATAITGQAICAISVEDDSTPTATATTAMLERSGVKWRSMGNTYASNGTTLTHTYSAKKFFGIKDIGDVNKRLGANFYNTPAEQAYYHVKVAAVDGAGDIAAVAITVVIEYLVLCTERNKLIQST